MRFRFRDELPDLLTLLGFGVGIWFTVVFWLEALRLYARFAALGY